MPSGAVGLGVCVRTGDVRRFLHITWPLLLPYTYTVVLLTTMGTLRIFDMMWIMTQGGPAHATETVATYIFTTAFRFQRAGYAQSLAFILLGLVALLTVTLRKRASEFRSEPTRAPRYARADPAARSAGMPVRSLGVTRDS